MSPPHKLVEKMVGLVLVDISNIRFTVFDFKQTGYTLQTKRTFNIDRGSFMLVAATFEGVVQV